jgi:small subunit ribosomal protein S17
MQGEVASNKADKTIVVSVTRRFKHPVYKKFVTSSSKYMAHDPQNAYKAGDSVKIVECRPYSKNKTWHVVEEQAQNNEG